jgi:hypothetical protein
MKKITVEMIMDKKPCEDWTEERIRGYIGRGKTIKEILNLKDVYADSRIWCVTRFLSDKTNRKFAIWCAEQCKTDVQEIKDYIKVIKRYYAGKATDKELKAAAERAADWAADWAADSAADWAADSAAYGAADWAADWAAERQKQIKKLLTMI